MGTPLPTDAELTAAIEAAARQAIQELFQQHPGRYYYLSLITSGEAHAPVLAAWSEEALAAAAQDAGTRYDFKWSYADSPYYCFGEKHFDTVNELFARRPALHRLDDAAGSVEYARRLEAMEVALANLDRAGLFGTGAERLRLVINVEVMPPDSTNTLRARRLNPPEALATWLEEAAEPE